MTSPLGEIHDPFTHIGDVIPNAFQVVSDPQEIRGPYDRASILLHCGKHQVVDIILQLVDFDVVHPQGDELAALYEGLNVGVRVRRGDRPGMRAVIQAGGKEIILSSVG